MPRRYQHGARATCTTSFLAAGQRFAKGDELPYALLGLDELNVRGLWMAEKIDFVEPAQTVAIDDTDDDVAPAPVVSRPPQPPQHKHQQRR